MTRTMTAITAALTLVLVPSAVAQAAPPSKATAETTSSKHGIIQSTVIYVPGRDSPTPQKGHPLTAAGQVERNMPSAISLDTPEDEAFKKQCESQEAAKEAAGWYRDRISNCTRRLWINTIANTDGVEIGDVTSDITILGIGSNGTREIRYVIYIENIRKRGAPDLILDTYQIRVSIAGCDPATVTCPTTTERDAPVPAWRLQEDWSITFTSPDTAGGGPQIVPQTLFMRLSAHSPQPNFLFPPPFDTMISKSRYDSADYVGAAKGAVFTDYSLVFVVDVNDPTQDESALHILQAQTRPELTFPSWVGKNTPGKTIPLKRMYNSANNTKNRTKSVAMCKSIWGEYDGKVQNCDEYPFASTYEGSFTGSPQDSDPQRYSVRVIDADDNQHVGRDMLENNFYKRNRVLDGDLFLVKVNT